MNRLLQDLYDTWFAQDQDGQYESLTKALSSHSGRAGGAQDASDHRDIQVQWIIPRGSMIHKLKYFYIHNNYYY